MTLDGIIETFNRMGCDDCRGDRSKEPFKATDIKAHIWSHSEDGDYGEGSAVALVELNDGRIGYVAEWSDTSGHG